MSAVPDEVQGSYGVLPEGWRLEKLKFFSVVRNSNVDKVIADDEEDVRLCNYTDVYYNDRITPDVEFKAGSATPAEIERFQLKRGQVILTKDSESWEDIGIPALVTENMPDVLCGYHLAVVEPTDRDLDGGYLAWLCRSEPLNNQFKLGANGVTRFGLGQYPLKNAFIALPPLETQRRIAQFLDDKTARIDALIEKKRALLDRLAEKRQALITHAVTKGLDPKAPMKDSGIDWLGRIPAHWKVKRLRYVVRLVSGSTPTTTVAEYWDGDIPWISPKDMKSDVLRGSIDKVTSLAVDECGLRKFQEPNAVLVVRGMILARRVPVAVALGTYTINQDMKVMESKGLLSPRFLQMYLMSVESYLMTLVGEAGHGTKALRTDVLLDTPVLIPPPDEQGEIILRLVRKEDVLDQAAEKLEMQINRLTEYRATLITAAVIGKMEGLQ